MVSLLGPGHSLPLKCGGGLSQVLVWFKVPNPQVAEQGVIGFQGLQPPSTIKEIEL